jgi:hypothetical protein
MIPGVTNGMLDDWDQLHDEQIQEQQEQDVKLAQATAARAQRVSGTPKPTSPNGTQTKPVSGN